MPLGQIVRLLAIVLIAVPVLAACSRLSGGPVSQQRTASLPPAGASQQQASVPPTSTQTGTQSPEPGTTEPATSLFVDSAALAKMSGNDRTEAASAQYYAFRFGRPGAPRNWSGDSGATGRITVGPFVRVNNLDCREFEHTVTIDGQDYSRSGTSCREQDGSWTLT